MPTVFVVAICVSPECVLDKSRELSPVLDTMIKTAKPGDVSCFLGTSWGTFYVDFLTLETLL